MWVRVQVQKSWEFGNTNYEAELLKVHLIVVLLIVPHSAFLDDLGNLKHFESYSKSSFYADFVHLDWLDASSKISSFWLELYSIFKLLEQPGIQNSCKERTPCTCFFGLFSKVTLPNIRTVEVQPLCSILKCIFARYDINST